MTFNIVSIIGILQKSKGLIPLRGLLYNQNWPQWKKQCYNLLFACHAGHLLELSVALLFYFLLFPIVIVEAKVFNLNWILKVVAFNIAMEFLTFGFWHWFTFIKNYKSLEEGKYNSNNPYGKNVGFFTSSNGLLQREIFLTTLGWLQSSAYQCIILYLWASGRLEYERSFWDRPIYNIASILLVTYWREFHFYWCHRMIHPWWKKDYGLAQGDIGAFLYRHFHSVHHKSYNPGPWSGLSMHPVEHFFYYTVTLLPLIFSFHPLHFLYAKYHADISPIGGHDGFSHPAGGNAYHWLHHATFECNYGTDLIDFDKLFGTYVDYDEYIKKKSVEKDS